MYYKQVSNNQLKSYQVRILAVLRFVAVLLVSLLLSKLFFKSEQKEVSKPIFIIANDNSSSILQRTDSLFDEDSYKNYVEEIQSRLANNFDVRSFDFGETLSKGISYTYSDSETNFSQLFKQIQRDFSNKKVSGLLVLSDGINNKGPDPLQSIKSLNIKTDVLALGDTTMAKDIYIDRIYYNREVYLGNRFPVYVNVKANNYSSDTLLLQVFEKDSLLRSRELLVSDNNYFNKIAFDFEAQVEGVHTYQFKVSGQSNELNLNNNKKSIVFNVRDDAKNILLLHKGQHPDIAAFKHVFENKKAFNIYLATPKDEFDLDTIDLTILYQIPAGGSQELKLVKIILEKSIPSLFVLGENNDVQAFNQLRMGVNVAQKKNVFDEVKASFNPDFALFNVNEGYAKAQFFPPLRVPFGDYSSLLVPNVLFYQQIGNSQVNKPLIYYSALSNSSLGFILGEGFWRWRLYDYQLNGTHDLTDDILVKSAQYLLSSTKTEHLELDYSVEYFSNETVWIQARLFNASNEAVVTPIVNLLLLDENNKQYPYVFNALSSHYNLDIGKLDPGKYRFLVSLDFAGKSMEKEGEFVVSEIDIENNNLEANHRFLNQLTELTNGNLYYPDNIEALLTDLTNYEGQDVVEIKEQYKQLMDLILVFVLIVLALFLEWFLRKFWGGV